MSTYESFSYMPNDCFIYRQWLKRQPVRLDLDKWFVMGLIGVVMGVVGFALHQLTVVISDLKWNKAAEFIEVRFFLTVI
jgi:hypothetical protein